jgi:hypothetical protein
LVWEWGLLHLLLGHRAKDNFEGGAIARTHASRKVIFKTSLIKNENEINQIKLK